MHLARIPTLLAILSSAAFAAGETLPDIQSKAEEQLQSAEQRLAALRSQIEADTLPLVRKLNDIETKLITNKISLFICPPASPNQHQTAKH